MSFWTDILAPTPIYSLLIEPQEQAIKLQKQAMQQQKEAADRLAVQQDMQFNKQNQKKPNINAFWRQNAAAAGPGTMLTGPSGIDTSSLLLGKTSLLGS